MASGAKSRERHSVDEPRTAALGTTVIADDRACGKIWASALNVALSPRLRSRVACISIMAVATEDIAEEIRSALPGTEEIVVQYLSGYLSALDDAAEDEDVLQVTREILDSAVGSTARQSKLSDLERVVTRLGELLQDSLSQREEKNRAGTGNGLVRLDKVMDLSKGNVMSSTIAFTEGVDLESINKGK